MSNVGIEIEAESTQVSQHALSALFSERQGGLWELDRGEGSLRGGEYGWEIKTVGDGIPFETVPTALSQLYPVMVGSSGVWRAGVHVHVDVRDLSFYQRALVLALAYVVDYSLFDLVAPERVESNFCVPLERKSYLVLEAINAMAFGQFPRGYGKYSSVNIDCARTFGTFEFRHMRTPACDSTVPSVSAALSQVRSFVSVAHDIVNMAKLYAGSLSTRAEVLSAFTQLASSRALWSTRGLTISNDALLAVCMKLIAPSRHTERTVLPPTRGRPSGIDWGDMASLPTATYRRMRAGPMSIDDVPDATDSLIQEEPV